jgi:precorrin-6A/cobalt-precorrin-6A reductase
VTATPTLLLLGGTAEARALAARLVDRADPAGLRVITSLAGRLAQPRLPAGQIRSGGFGGIAPLAAWLARHTPALLVDATHPFAARISEHAWAAAAATGTPLLRLARPGWVAGPGDRWWRVPELRAAADLLPTLGARPLVTTGRQDLAAFTENPACARLDLVLRCVEPPGHPLPARTTVLLASGPYTLAAERALMRQHRIDVLVTKDSGGESTRAKLDAARELGVPVVMVDRPHSPRGAAAIPTVTTVGQAERWVLDSLGQL